MKKEDFFSKLKNKRPSDDETERTKEFNKIFDIKKSEKITKIYLKGDVILLADLCENFVKVSTGEYESIRYIV